MLSENLDCFKCEFCGTIFKHKSSLKKHMESAKFCLQIQNNLSPPVKEIKKFICEYCDTEFKAKRNLQSHYDICKERNIINTKIRLEEEHIKQINTLKLEHSKEINNLKLEHSTKLDSLKTEYLETVNEQKIIIAELKGKIEIYERDHNVISDIAKQTKITNNNNNNNIINNMAVYDINSIKERLANTTFTKTHIMNGQSGIADAIAPYLIDENGNKMITCTDIPRLSFTKIDDNKNRIKDHELKNLATDIKPLALQKADEIIEEHNKLRDKLCEIKRLKYENRDYEQFIKQMQNNIANYKLTNSSNKNKMVDDYQSKIENYENRINENNALIEKYKDVSNIDANIIEDENDKLIDGHTEIKQLDSESSKFARRVSKLI